MADPAYTRKRRIVGLVSLTVLLALMGAVTYIVCTQLLGKVHSPEEFRDYIEAYGWWGRAVFLGLQCLQVLIALIPGEVIEVGAGYAFGAVEGTLLCFAGVAIASSLIFLLVKRWGIRLVELFVSREKIDELRFINSDKKLKRTIFILYFIPGTPKDLITYFAGLTRIQLHEFLIISMLARIPSIVSSVIGGHIIQSQQYGAAVILFLITGAVSLGGMTLYSLIVKRKNQRAAHNDTGGE